MIRRSDLAEALHKARYELACERCQNAGSIMTNLGLDECPGCHGYGRHTETIKLLEELVRREEARP